MTAAGLHTTPTTVEFRTGDSTGYGAEVQADVGDDLVCITVHGGGEGSALITAGDARRMARALTEAASRADKAAQS